MQQVSYQEVEVRGTLKPRYEEILNPNALQFLAQLHIHFEIRRRELLERRVLRQNHLDSGELPHFRDETEAIRNDPTWQVVPTPPFLQCRYVEITGPTDRKMIINAMNSGADVFMADCEDANVPTWENMVDAQVNLRDTVNGTISHETPEGKSYTLGTKPAVLFFRPRGWHLNERHVLVQGQEMSGSLFDFGLFFFHNAQTLLKQGKCPCFYLPKLENYLEARLWNDAFILAQTELGIPQGSIRATVLVETIMAAFQMDEILFELKEHSAGLNAGRWDYIFSVIKKFNSYPNLRFPNRDQITMTVPFMRSYQELIVQTCHKRGVHAIGGMAAFIPNKNDPEVTELALKKVREDKEREAKEGFDGTWVAHPALVPVAREIFEKALEGKPNQKERKREDVFVVQNQLINFDIEGSTITEQGVRQCISVTLRYLISWLNGRGAVAIDNMMEDTATAEICRAQLWQWCHKHSKMLDGREINKECLDKGILDEARKLAKITPEEQKADLDKALTLLRELVLDERFAEFLTVSAYKLIP